MPGHELGLGLDNLLLRATLADDHEVLLRIGKRGGPSPWPRADKNLLLAYRTVGCLRWVSSHDWEQWEHDPSISAAARSRLAAWHSALNAWIDELAEHVRRLS